MNKVISVSLLLFVLCSIGYAIYKEAGSNNEQITPSQKSSNITVYYFYSRVRCATCIKMEKYTEEAVKTGFSEMLEKGELVWAPTNIDEPQNEIFIKKYRLHTKAVVISKNVEGKEVEWKNLDRIWELVRDKQSFTSYIKSELNQFIGKSE